MTGFSCGPIPLRKACAAGLVNVEFEDFALRRFYWIARSSPEAGASGERFCLTGPNDPGCSIQVAAIRTVAVGYWLSWPRGSVTKSPEPGRISGSPWRKLNTQVDGGLCD